MSSKIVSCLVFSLFILACNGQGDTDNEEEMSIKPKPLNVKVGQSFFVTCSVIEDISVNSIGWFDASGNPIQAGTGTGNEALYTDKSDDNAIDLTFNNVRPKHSGGYTCKANLNDGRTMTRNYVLQVIQSIKFVDTPTEQYGAEGSDYLVRCVTKSQPPASVDWFSNGRKIRDNEKYNKLDDGLMIFNLTRKDQKKYRCTAKMATELTSEIESKNIQLIVQYVPECKEETKHTYSIIGSAVKLKCEANAEPSPSFEWYHLGLKIENNTEGMIIESDNTSSTLQFNVEMSSMMGDYTCKAINTVGQCSQVIKVSEYGTPDLLKLSGDSSGLKVEVNAHSKGHEHTFSGITKIKIQYKKSNESWDFAKTADFNYGTKPYIIKALEHETKYDVRVAAGSELGYGKYSNQLSYKVEKKKTASAAPSVYTSSTLMVFILTTVVTLFFS